MTGEDKQAPAEVIAGELQDSAPPQSNPAAQIRWMIGYIQVRASSHDR